MACIGVYAIVTCVGEYAIFACVGEYALMALRMQCLIFVCAIISGRVIG